MRLSIKGAALALALVFLLPIPAVYAAGYRYLVSLGTPVQPTPGWNNLTAAAAGTTLGNLVDYPNGAASGIGLVITDAFWCTSGDPGASNRDGTTSSTVYPASATANSFFIADHLGFVDLAAKLRLTGLSDHATYTVRLYASRMGTDAIDRTTRYTINGMTRDLQVLNNVNGYAEFTGLLPVNGQLDIAVDIAPGATYGFLGVLELIETGNYFGIDLGTPVAPTPGWNNLTSAATGTQLPLNSLLGDPSGINLSITDSFWNTASDPGASNRDGTTTSTIFPASATSNSFFVVDQLGVSDLTAALRFSGLLTNTQYSIRLFGSRMATTDTNDRSTLFTISGITKDLQVTNNIDNYVEYPSLTTSTGNLDLSVGIKPGAFAGLLGLVELQAVPKNGLLAEHYNGSNFDDLVVTRYEPYINNDWPTGSPDASVNADFFSNRWTGQIQPQFSETYTFTTRSDDGVRLWVNGVLIINNWTNHFPVDNTGSIALVAGTKYSIKLEHYEVDLGSVAQLSWQSASQPKQIVPQSAFFPPLPVNFSPIASAGTDKSITLPTSSVTLAGTGSDSDGTVASYRWTKLAGGAATITTPIESATTVTGLAAGTYTFRLTVNDNKGNAGSDDVVVTVLAANVPPTANAGTDKTITLPTNSVTLTGSATDSDGSITTYGWSKIAGGAATIATPAAATTAINGLAAGSYTFRLTVTDNRGGTDTDDVIVTVLAANVLPTANAGADKLVQEPATTVTLTGSGTDSDGTIATYAWTKVSGGTATIASPAAASTSISGLVVGTAYTFRLTVTDNRGGTDTDDVIVTVNKLPTVNAGVDQTIVAPASTANLAGSGADTDGTIASYAWAQVSGGAATISAPAAASTGVSGLAPGVYVFRLTVTDNRGGARTDDVTISVASAAVETQRPLGSVAGANFGYIEYLPEGYNLQTNWPVIIFLHGIGERAIHNGVVRPLSVVAGFGPNSYASPTRGNHKLACVILQPQCPAEPQIWQNSTQTQGIETFRAFAYTQYKLDPKRFYLTGLSMGGFGTSAYLNTVNFGRKVAAAVPICPANISATGAAEVVNNGVPIWAAHAQDDPTSGDMIGVSDNGFKNLNVALGGAFTLNRPAFVNPPTPPAFASMTGHFDPASKVFVFVSGQQTFPGVPEYFYTVYSSGGHTIWDRMYFDSKVYTWLFAHTRP